MAVWTVFCERYESLCHAQIEADGPEAAALQAAKEWGITDAATVYVVPGATATVELTPSHTFTAKLTA